MLSIGVSCWLCCRVWILLVRMVWYVWCFVCLICLVCVWWVLRCLCCWSWCMIFFGVYMYRCWLLVRLLFLIVVIMKMCLLFVCMVILMLLSVSVVMFILMCLSRCWLRLVLFLLSVFCIFLRMSSVIGCRSVLMICKSIGSLGWWILKNVSFGMVIWLFMKMLLMLW